MLELAFKKRQKERLLHSHEIVRNWLKCAVSILHLHLLYAICIYFMCTIIF